MCTVFSKRVVSIITVLIIVFSSSLLFTSSASAEDLKFNYLINTIKMVDVFPDYDASEATFYSDYNWTGESVVVTGSDIFYGPDTWPYIHAFTDSLSACGSAYLALYLNLTNGYNYDVGSSYVFDFTFKFNGGIGSAYSLSSIGIKYQVSSSTDIFFRPQSVWESGPHTYAHFNFIVPGKYLSVNGKWDQVFILSFNAAPLSRKLFPSIYVWIDPNNPFTVRPLTTEEYSASLTGQSTADSIADIGSDIDLPDTSGTLNSADDLMSKMEVEKDYKIDPDESSTLLADSNSLFEQSDFTNAFSFINDCVERYLDTSAAMYIFYTCILGLGVAFAALGRSL